MGTAAGLKVSEVARHARVNLQTIHYYERRGLLPKPPRSAANYRIYPEEAVRRVRFIKRAQALGFSLAEIKQLLALRASAPERCETAERRARQKIREIDEKVEGLQAMRAALVQLVERCKARRPSSPCPILDSLEDDKQ